MSQSNKRSLLAAPCRYPPILCGKICVLGFRRDLRDFDEDLPQPAIPLPSLATQALATTFVVARTHPGPGGEMLGAGETAHIGADLRDENLGRPLTDPRNRIEEGDGFLVRRQSLVNFCTKARDRLVQVLQRAQVLGQQEAMVRCHASCQGFLELVTLGPQAPPG